MPDRPTEADLARWEALADQATPGPWTARHRDSSNPTQDPARDGEHLGWHLDPLAVPDRGQIVRGADAAFLAESRTAVPALVAEVRRLRDVLTRIADGDGYGSATECWCWDIAADRIRELEAENRMLRNTLDEVWSGVQEKRRSD